MGWLPSIFGGGDNPADPVSQLDPSLRDFMRKEAPAKYSPDQDTKTTSPPPPTIATATPAPAKEETKPQEGRLPQESLYQDGRYAHLWKTYRPLAELEAESATDHDQVSSILDEYKERKAAVGKAALENCALVQEEWANCMKAGSWEDRMQMCKYQVRRFEKCHNMQGVRNRCYSIESTANLSSDSYEH